MARSVFRLTPGVLLLSHAPLHTLDPAMVEKYRVVVDHFSNFRTAC